MSPDVELMVIFGAMHLVALLFGGLLFVMFLRSEPAAAWREPDEGEDGGGGNDRRRNDPRRGPPGDGLPLPDAEPASQRLRTEHDRLTPEPATRRRDVKEPRRERTAAWP